MEKEIKQDDNLLEQVKTEYQLGLDYIKPKRQKMLDRIGLYNNQAKQDNRVSVPVLYTTVNTLLANYFNDTLNVKFMERTINDSMAAMVLNDVAKFDWDEMGLQAIDYQTQWDRLMHGVGIRKIGDEWDMDRKVPVAHSVDPLTFIPDPNGHTDIKHFSFIGFEKQVVRSELTEERGFSFVDKIMTDKAIEEQEKENRINSARGYINDDRNRPEENDIVSVYYHYTSIEGIKHLVVTANKNSLIIKKHKLEAVTNAEKKNPLLIPFPFALNYYHPLRNDPLGLCIPDLVEDKQKGQTILANLQLIREKNASVGGDMLVNTDKVKNMRNLSTPSLNPKFVPVKGDITGVMAEIPKATISPSSYNVRQSLERDAALATGASPNESGVLSDEKKSAAEVKQTQANADIRKLLSNSINAVGEKCFWKLWYRAYKNYLSSADGKFVRVSGVHGMKSITISRKDINTLEDPDVSIIMQSEAEAINQKKKLGLQSVIPTIMSNPESTTFAKNYVNRLLARLNNFSHEEAIAMFPESIDEEKAWMDVELINNGQVTTPLSMNEEHDTYLVIYKYAEDNKERAASIRARRMAKIRQQQQQAQLQQQEGVHNENNALMQSASTQMNNAAIQANNEQQTI